MKTMISCMAIAMLFLALALPAKAVEPTTLRFGWGYDEEAQAIIDGFRLYANGQALDISILPAARSVETPYIKDRLGRRYHLTAFAGSDESPPSAYVDIPAFWSGIPAVIGGTMVIHILDEDGNVIQELSSAVQGTINQ